MLQTNLPFDDQIAVPTHIKVVKLKQEFISSLFIAAFSTTLVKSLLSKLQFKRYNKLRAIANQPQNANLKNLIDYRDLLRAGEITFKKFVFGPRQIIFYTIRSFLHQDRNSDNFQVESSLKKAFYNFAIAGYAAFCGEIVVYPFDIRRNMTANGYAHLIKYGDYGKREGMRAYWKYMMSEGHPIINLCKGFPIYVLGQVIQKSIAFGLFDTFKLFVPDYPNSIPYQFGLGLFSTALSLLAVFPNDNLRRKQILTKELVHEDAFEALKATVRQEGVRGLWRGVGHMLWYRSLSGALIMTLYEQIKTYHRQGLIKDKIEGRKAKNEIKLDLNLREE